MNEVRLLTPISRFRGFSPHLFSHFPGDPAQPQPRSALRNKIFFDLYSSGVRCWWTLSRDRVYEHEHQRGFSIMIYKEESAIGIGHKKGYKFHDPLTIRSFREKKKQTAPAGKKWFISNDCLPWCILRLYVFNFIQNPAKIYRSPLPVPSSSDICKFSSRYE